MELPAFLASALFLISMLGGAAAGLFPNILVSTLDAGYNLDVYNASVGGTGLRIGLIWWLPALLLAVGYFTYLFRSFRGKVTLEADEHGYG